MIRGGAKKHDWARLAAIAALVCVPPGCGGDPMTTTDGGVPGADAPLGDRDGGPRPMCTDVASRSFTVDVISSPARIVAPTPLEGASVRVEHPCGASAEGHTGADGSVTLTVDGPSSGWTVTAARRGLSATSVADLSGSPTGPLRIDPLDDVTMSLARQTVSGTVTGAASGALVSIDAYDFDTIGFAPTTGTFSTGFYVGASSPPLELVALEQVGGSLTRIARAPAMSPRPTTPVTGVALDFTGAPLTPVRTTHTIRGGASGATIMAYTPLTYAAEVDAAWVQAGIATAGSSGGSPTVTIEHLPGLVPDLVIAAGELIPGAWTQVAIHDFDGAPHDVMLGAVTMIPEIVGRGVAGTGDYDTLVLYVDETESHASRWRLYCSASLHDRSNPCEVPSLPSDVSLSDLRLAPGASSLGVLISMHEGSAWSTAVTNFASANIDHQVAGRYTPLPL